MLAALTFAAALSVTGPLIGDFDRDGAPDRAELRQTSARDYGIFVTRGASPRQPELIRKIPASNLSSLFLEPLDAADLHTWCLTKSSHPACAVVPPEDTPLLSFGTEEASQAVVIWRDNRPQVFWLTD